MAEVPPQTFMGRKGLKTVCLGLGDQSKFQLRLDCRASPTNDLSGERKEKERQAKGVMQ